MQILKIIFACQDSGKRFAITFLREALRSVLSKEKADKMQHFTFATNTFPDIILTQI